MGAGGEAGTGDGRFLLSTKKPSAADARIELEDSLRFESLLIDLATGFVGLPVDPVPAGGNGQSMIYTARSSVCRAARSSSACDCRVTAAGGVEFLSCEGSIPC